MSDESEKAQVEVTYLFDEILARHMERLLGSRHGIGGLQLKIGTIACLTLIADQLSRNSERIPRSFLGGTASDPEQIESPREVEDSPQLSAGNFNRENNGDQEEENTALALENRLAELGLRDKMKVQSLLREMIEKGYLLSDEQGKLSGGRPAVSMAKLLERVFPKLPGETLVAYFIQTIDEVRSGRKTPELAVAHFDQTLKMQGLPVAQLKAEKTAPAQTPAKKEPLEFSPQESRQALKRTDSSHAAKQEPRTGFRIIGSSEDGYRYSAKSTRTTPPVIPSETAIPLGPAEEREAIASGTTGQDVTQEEAISSDIPAEPVSKGTDVSLEATSDMTPANLPVEKELAESASEEIAAMPPSEEQRETDGIPDEPSACKVMDDRVAPPEDAENEQVPGEVEEGTPEIEEISPATGEVSDETERGTVEIDTASGGPQRIEDDLIDKQVAGFQSELASQCPLCTEGKVREEKTGTGRVYFKCTNKSCTLVSWGRPHHISCPVCNNPFLIEMSAGEETINLQCPRATCKYRCTVSQTDPSPGRSGAVIETKPRRRVVRRRVVRRKK